MHGKWTWNRSKRAWEARLYLRDGRLSEVFAEVDRTVLGWHWLRWPTPNATYAPGFTNFGIERNREEAMEVAVTDLRA